VRNISYLTIKQKNKVMKKVENFLAYLLFIAVVISAIFVLTDCTSVLYKFFSLVVPKQTITTILLSGSFISIVAAVIFPFWHVGRYLQTYSVKRIMDYRREYKLPYLSSGVGFLSLLISFGAFRYSAIWVYGALMTLLAVTSIIAICLENRKNNQQQK